MTKINIFLCYKILLLNTLLVLINFHLKLLNISISTIVNMMIYFSLVFPEMKIYQLIFFYKMRFKFIKFNKTDKIKIESFLKI